MGEGWFATLAEVPRQAVTMSVRQILRARRIVCTVLEKRKAAPARACLELPIDPVRPASILRRHAACAAFLDRDAASLLAEPVAS